jgi:hypothetical protein
MRALVPVPDQAHRSKQNLFDHLVGCHLEAQWHWEVKRLSGLEVYDQLESSRLHDGQVGGLLDVMA